MQAAGAAQAAAESPAPGTGRVLLLYDSLALGTPREKETAAVERLLAALGARITVSPLAEYRAGTLTSFHRLLLLVNDPEIPAASPALEQDLAAYAGSVLQLGGLPPAAGGPGPRRWGPAPAGDAAGRASTAGLLRDWLGAAGQPRTYVLIRGFSPYSDFRLLQSLADELDAGGIPYAVSARPVLENLQYPAMRRYEAALRYIQARQGSVLMEAPAVFPVIAVGEDPLYAQTAAFLDALMEAGVAPLGVAAEQYWSHDRHYSKAGMGFFDSAVLFPDTAAAPVYRERTADAQYFQSLLYSIGPDFPGGWEMLMAQPSAIPVSAAAVLDFPQSSGELDVLLKRLKAYPGVWADYRETGHRTATDRHSAESVGGAVVIDGMPLKREAQETMPPEDYVYTERETASFTAFFSAQNRIFLAVVLMSLGVFSFFILAGRRLYRRKFMK